MNMTASDDTTLIIERVLNASPQEVYNAWTDPAILVKWWGPEGMTTPVCEMDVQPDGAWITTMRNSEGGEHTVSGSYKTLSPPDHLIFSWGWAQDDGTRGHETLVDVRMIAEGDKTRMVMTQQVFAEKEHRDNHNLGWSSSFNKLEAVFA